MSRAGMAAAGLVLLAATLQVQAAHALAWSDVIADGKVVMIAAGPYTSYGKGPFTWNVTFQGIGKNSVYDKFLVWGPGADFTSASSSQPTWTPHQLNKWTLQYKGSWAPVAPGGTETFHAAFNHPIDPSHAAIHVSWVDEHNKKKDGWYTTPEPGSAALMGLGLSVLGVIRRRRKPA